MKTIIAKILCFFCLTAATSFLIADPPPPDFFIGQRFFTNYNAISIPTTQGIANPYPSIITVSNMSGCLTQAQVTLRGFSHDFPKDVDIVLENPVGTKIYLMSDAGGNVGTYNKDLTFIITSTNYVPENTSVVSTNYRPANYEGSDSLPTLGTVSSTNLNSFTYQAYNGDWKLYVYDDGNGDGGGITNWSLGISTYNCTNTPNFTGPPTDLERYGYHIHFNWTTNPGPFVTTWWSASNYQDECSMIPINHICVNGMRNSNALYQEYELISWPSNGTFIAVWWAPNATNRDVEFTTDLMSTNWYKISYTAPTNTYKGSAPYKRDPLWPQVFTIGDYTNELKLFLRLRRKDFGVGCEVLCQ